MDESFSEIDAQHAIHSLVGAIGDLQSAALRLDENTRTKLYVSTAALSALLAGASSGECRLQLPTAPIQIVSDDNGFRYCCTHPTPHCSPPMK